MATVTSLSQPPPHLRRRSDNPRPLGGTRGPAWRADWFPYDRRCGAIVPTRESAIRAASIGLLLACTLGAVRPRATIGSGDGGGRIGKDLNRGGTSDSERLNIAVLLPGAQTISARGSEHLGGARNERGSRAGDAHRLR